MQTWNPPTKVVSAVLAAIIAVVLAGGVIAVLTHSSGESAQEKQAKQNAAAQKQAADERKRQADADRAAAGSAEADRKALDLITANQQACNDRLIPNANARADQALKDLGDQRAALEKIEAELPAGKAKDTLASQIGPGFDSSEALIKSEQRSAISQCQLAFTVFQLTREPPTTAGD
ncbi:MAG TPA: hypothetical protein VHS52_09600 [Acidimicrobiales bacterium]|jgi:type II secretory pathway pseudopilin PulG|nr:hypothetical protein [Acidimicrobiales bacterium]